MSRRYTGPWNTPDLSADGLKNFACLVMALQTVGIAVVEHGMIHVERYTQESLSTALAARPDLMVLAGVSSVLQLLGGMAVPIFAFLLVEGFQHTSSFGRYLFSLACFAVVSEIPYDLAVYGTWWDMTGQNALVSMTVSLLMLYFLRMVKEQKGAGGVLGRCLIVFCAVLWVSFLRAGYGLCVVLLAAVFYLLYGSHGWKVALGILISLLYVTGPLAFYGIWCYDGSRKNRVPKYVYYAFYPLHLLVLGVVAKGM